MLAEARTYWTDLGYELVDAKDGRVWRVKRGEDQDGKPHTGKCSWHASTGGAARSDQWKFGASREEVIARITA